MEHSWLLSWFAKDGDALVGELDLPLLSDEDASRVVNFAFGGEYGFGGEFPLDDSSAHLLSQIIGRKVETDRWDYFLGARALPG